MTTSTSEQMVRIETNLGNMTIKLYNETPLHRDNFIKLVNDGTYNGLLFHRVIREFMAQGGDVTSKGAPMNKSLGAGDLGYTVPAEFVYPQLFHKKGALCAARTGDEGNPLKASSASQFYLATGKKYSAGELKQMEKQLANRLLHSIFNRLQIENKDKVKELYRSGDRDEMAIFKDTLIGRAELEAAERKAEACFTPEQIEAYTTVGGVPFLDNEYTVYGEVVEGLNILEQIELLPTNGADRPKSDVVINQMVLLNA